MMKIKTSQKTGRERGFTLIEVLIVVAIVAVIAAFSVIGYPAVIRVVHERLAAGHLREIAEAQQQYRATQGKRRYGSLEELRAAQTGSGPLMNSQIAPVDKSSNPLPVGGWLIRESADSKESPGGRGGGGGIGIFPIYSPPPIFIDPSENPNNSYQTAFAIEAAPADGNSSTNVYCIHEDGVLRLGDVASGCNSNSPAY